jgi:hypothetical protein
LNHDIRTIAVLGAGAMGRGIAHVSATGGFVTHVFDVDSEVLHKAQSMIHRNLDKGVDLGKVDSGVAENARSNLHLKPPARLRHMLFLLPILRACRSPRWLQRAVGHTSLLECTFSTRFI